MVRLWASPLGGYPRGRHARYVMRDLDSGKLEFHRASIEVDRSQLLVIGAQLAAGMKYIVDGMLDWHDIIRPFAESWRNVYLDGIIRYFDNNFFYRIPVFRGEPEPQRLVLPGRVASYKMLAEPAGLKVVLPGPFTVLKLGRNESGLEDSELLMRIASALSIEAEKAVEAGAAMVQIDEPYLADPDVTPDEARTAVEAVNIVAGAAREAKTLLAIYFDAPKPEVYEVVLEARTDYIALDLGDTGKRGLGLLEAKGCGSHGLVIGVIDARNIYDDDYNHVKSLVEESLSRCKGELDDVGLTTTTWLDLIPLRFSLRKTHILGSYMERIAADLGLEADIPISTAPKPYWG